MRADVIRGCRPRISLVDGMVEVAAMMIRHHHGGHSLGSKLGCVCCWGNFRELVNVVLPMSVAVDRKHSVVVADVGVGDGQLVAL